jgi:transposase
MQALDLKQQGWKQRDIATALGVTEGAVSQWLAAARASGPAALRARRVPGAPARLTATQRNLLPELLWHGAEAYGFRGDVWTCTRVAHVIRSTFGVTYSKSQVSRLLAALNWTPQLPIERALQRDEAAIAHWRSTVWPALHTRAQQEQRTLVFVDEAGFYLLAGTVRTYAPKGQTPVLATRQSRDHLSVMGGLTPAGAVYMLVREEALTGAETIMFLQHLLRHAGARLLVIWDGSPIHWRAEVQDFVAGLDGQPIVLEPLPGYAPDLNPWDAGGWQHLKHGELGNVGRLNLAALHRELDLAIGRLRQKPELIQSFFHAAGLAL